MKLKIVSDGTRAGTKLTTLDGEPVENVLLVSWNLSTEDELAIAMVEIIGVPCEIITEYRHIQVSETAMVPSHLVVEDEDWTMYRLGDKNAVD